MTKSRLLTFCLLALLTTGSAFAQPTNQETTIEQTTTPDNTNPTTTPTNTNKESYDDNQGGQGGQPNDASSANPNPSARDGLYDKVSVQEKQALPYDHLREADIFWQKRVWRVIDTKQKMNQGFTYTKEPFIQVLLDVVKTNPNVRVYVDDEFKTSTSFTDITSQLGSADTIMVINPETYEETQKIVQNDFDWATVSRFRVKEDWVFDQESSRMIVRILGVSPIRDVIDKSSGELRGTQAMFWAYYPDLREHFIRREAFNQGNDLNCLTWDDVFEMRLFSSFIMKELNMQDRRIQDYAQGKGALLESERVKKEIFEKEHNMWTY